MAIERYVGRFITAEDANDYIDGYTISSGCEMLIEATHKLSDIATALQELKEDLSSTNLSVEGSSMEPIIEEYEKNTMDFANTLSALVDNISATTQNVINNKQIRLNEEARLKDEQQANASEEII